MTDSERNFSRVDRKKGRKKSDKILNLLIGGVVLALGITAMIIFTGGDDQEKKDDMPANEAQKDATIENEAPTHPSDKSEGATEEKDLELKLNEEETAGIVTYLEPDDEVVEQSIVDPSWEPIATKQTGEHVSLYDGDSVDWHEKQEAIAYATGLAVEDTITWKIKNGGSPQKSIGIVSSKDKVEKYRVYLEWIENEGWKPTKLDVLKTLDFDY